MSYPIIESSSEKMDKVIEHLHAELNQIRTGMANAKMLDRVEVEYYGTPTPLNQIAGISVQEGRTLVIKPYDPSSLKDIEKACNQANLGIAPRNDGTDEDMQKDAKEEIQKLTDKYIKKIEDTADKKSAEVLKV